MIAEYTYYTYKQKTAYTEYFILQNKFIAITTIFLKLVYGWSLVLSKNNACSRRHCRRLYCSDCREIRLEIRKHKEEMSNYV